MEEKIIKIMQLVQIKKDNTVEFPEEARKLIREVAEKCRKLPVYKDNTDKVDTYKDGITAGEIYLDMCLKKDERPKLTKIEKCFVESLNDKWDYLCRNSNGELEAVKRTFTLFAVNSESLNLKDVTKAKFDFIADDGRRWLISELKEFEVEV